MELIVVIVGGRRGREGPSAGRAEDECALFEEAEGLAEAGVVDAEGSAESGLGAGGGGVAQGSAHGLGERGWWGIVAVELQAAGFLVSTGEAEEHRFGSRGGTVFDGEAELGITPDEIAARIDSGVQVARSAQRLSGAVAGAFGHVVDEHKGELIAAIELAQEAEELRDLGRRVFISCDQRGYVTAQHVLRRRGHLWGLGSHIIRGTQARRAGQHPSSMWAPHPAGRGLERAALQLDVDVGVLVGGQDADVAEPAANDHQIIAGTEKVHRRTVAERMGTDPLRGERW